MFVCAVSLAAAKAGCQSDPCKGTQTGPGDLSLHLSLKNGQTTFREGEIIPLVAEYSATTSKKYVLDNRNYDRSGRLSGMEVFCLAPNSGTDPLIDYFSQLGGIFGGGAFSMEDPGDKPHTVELQMNEWLSLPQGQYHLSIVGNRVGLRLKGTEYPTGRRGVPLRSNAVDFEVTSADSSWQSAQLSAVIRTLDMPDAAKEDRRQAARVLRFLDSEASTRELANRYRSGSDEFGWEFRLGLFGSPFRSVAIEAMKSALTDPAHPVTSEYVGTLVQLEMLSDPKFHPHFDQIKSPEESSKAFQVYGKEFDRRVDELMASAAATAAAKSPEARAITASEILRSGLTLAPTARDKWRQILIDNWNTLSVKQQNELLNDDWSVVGGPEWAPILKGIVAGPANPKHYAGRPSRSVALMRLLEIEPELARPLMLQEIATPKGDIGISVLGKLPERELPQFERFFIAGLEKSEEVDAELIERYANSQAFPQVRSIYETGPLDIGCSGRDALLRYFLRINPDFGAQMVAESLKERVKTGCFRTSLSAVGKFIRQQKLQDVAIATLDDPAPEVARDAANALSESGSAAAEDALWRRLEQFHRKWQGKPDSLLHPAPNMIEYNRDSGLEEALVKGITHGQAWFPTVAQITQLKELSSPAMQSDLDSVADVLSGQQAPLLMTWLPDGRLNYTIGWYNGLGFDRLKEKLEQFPEQIRFIDSSPKPTSKEAAEEFEQIERVVAPRREGSL
jgi:hypothetical protein